MLTGPTTIQTREGRGVAHPLKAGTTVYKGALVALEAGLAIPLTAAANLRYVGVAEATAVNEGADGDEMVTVLRIAVLAKNDAGDAVTRADVGAPAYGVDDETVARTDGGGARSPAGTIIAVDDAGVWIEP